MYEQVSSQPPAHVLPRSGTHTGPVYCKSVTRKCTMGELRGNQSNLPQQLHGILITGSIQNHRPRASAAAERLWSDEKQTFRVDKAFPRLQDFRCTLVRYCIFSIPQQDGRHLDMSALLKIDIFLLPFLLKARHPSRASACWTLQT